MVSVWTMLFAVTSSAQSSRFEISYTKAAYAGPLTGRLILIVSKSAQGEPRLAVSPTGPALFGVDVSAVAPDAPMIVDATALGYPMKLDALPAGEYSVQAIVNVYDQVKRADGHTLWLRMNDGRQESFNSAAGNIYSGVQRVRIGEPGTTRLTIDKVIAAPPKPVDTEWVKYLRIQSESLSRFWGRPVYVNATVLLPRGYTEHPEVRYPVIYTLGHNVPFSFNHDSTRGRGGRGQINAVTGVENGYDFYRSWISDSFPRVIAISLQQQTPYFPDSYSVNSANNGPYGDAITREIMPALEKHFRVLQKPYARQVEGASTGGWQTLALQLQHPDFFGGAWVHQPDPIDFRRYLQINIYEDTNAFVLPVGQLMTTERVFRRTVEGQPVHTVRSLSLFEEVLGSKGRSSYQLGAWEAVYGPVGVDGYPKPLWNKLTGTIDKSVAAYMRDSGYDLRAYAEKNWATLGPRLAGKLHFFAGDMDDFHLNLAVYQMESFLKSTTNPKSDATFVYGRPAKGHSWHAQTWADFVRLVSAAMVRNAPAGENTRAWRY
jgi:hypothetical protein